MNISSEHAEQYIGNVKFCTKEEAVAHVKKINEGEKPRYLDLWANVLKRVDISPIEAIELLQTLPTNAYKAGTAVFARQDVKEYLQSTLTLEEALSMLKTPPIKEIASGIFQRNDVLRYLHNIPPAEAIQFAEEAKNSDVWRLVFKRSTIPPTELIPLAEKTGIWNYWDILLGRADVLPADAISYAKKVDDSNVWKTVLGRKDVKEYLK